MALLHASSSLSILLFLLYCFETSVASPRCIPSACGTITNISFPFRLKADPKHCGDSLYELACENDVASLSLNSQKYYVKEINYHNSTFRLADASINNTTCSFPTSSLYEYTLSPVYVLLYRPFRPLNLMSCPYPLLNSSLFTHNFTHCLSSFYFNSSSHPNPRYSYIKVGPMKASEVPERCRVDVIVLTSWRFKDANNATLSEIQHSLLYGVEARFLSYGGISSPWGKNWERFMQFVYPIYYGISYPKWYLPILLVIVLAGVMCAVVCPVLTFSILSLLLLCTTYKFATAYLRYEYYELDLAQLGIALTLLGPRFIIFPIALWILIYKFRRRHLSVYNIIESFLQSDNRLTPIRYSYSDIKKMTRGFKDKIGEGGYGSVYKGKLKSGCDVAVKLLKKSGANDQDFTNEISTIGRIHHVNVVTLVGYCAQGSKRALIFDFMPNGSLEKYLFDRERNGSLNLDKKFEIAIGVARGVEYLHRGCDVQILHFDIKPHNVLLDDKFVPRISDFGLAKFYSIDKNTMTITAARGTIGYVAPELINRSIGAVSYKADVYSFGMLLMEMVSLNKDLSGNMADSNLYFPYWIYDRLNQGKDIEIEDADYDKDESMRRLVRKMTIVALWCIQMCPDDRPSMSKVLQMLEGNVESLHFPNYPSQSTHTIVNMDQSWSTYSTDSVALLSSNDASKCVEITVQE